MTATEDQAMSNATDDPDSLRVELIIHVCNVYWTLVFARPAPPLPPGICWHKGMVVELDNRTEFEVSSVNVMPGGSVEVRFDQIYCGKSTDSIVTDWTDDGWVLIREG